MFRRILDIMRAIPEIVIALVLIFVLGGGPIPAVLAIAFHTAGALGKQFSEVAENAGLKPVEGLASVGATWGQRIWFGILPQVAPNWLSYALMRFEINIRASAILGFVGAGGIGYDLKLAMQWGGGIGLLLTQAIITQKDWEEVAYYMVLIVLMVIVMDTFSGWLRRKLIHGAQAGH